MTTKAEFITWLLNQPQTRDRYFRPAHAIRPMVAVADMKLLESAYGDAIEFKEMVARTIAKPSFVVNWDKKNLRANIFLSIHELESLNQEKELQK